MKIIYTESFQHDYLKLDLDIQRFVDKALKFLQTSSRHPSLRIKKIPGTAIWYGRVSRTYRFTFQMKGEVITLRQVGTHSILNAERRRQ